MATDDTEDAVQPTVSPTDVAADATAALAKVGDVLDLQLLVAVNGAAGPLVSQKFRFPDLAEKQVLSYVKGSAQPLTAVIIDGFPLEKFTAYDFILMRRAAVTAGIPLRIVSGFRSQEQQQRIFAARQQPGVAAIKGVAARPGFSNHQGGVSIDIDVSPMHLVDLNNKNFGATYLWLRTNAIRFGFDQHDLGKNTNGDPLEPWHWTHISRKLYGVTTDTVSNVDTSAAANASVDRGQSKLQQYQSQALYDQTQAASRAVQASTTSWQTHQDNKSEQALFGSAGSGNYISQYVKATAAAKAPIPPFSPTTLGPLVYDFVTGLWGDGKPV